MTLTLRDDVLTGTFELPRARAPEARVSGAVPLTVGISGARRNAAVAACSGGTLSAFCEQERVTRVRGARLEPGLLPAEALAAALDLAGRKRVEDVRAFAVAESAVSLPHGLPVATVEHHRAHAASAFHTSPFARAAVVVCDRHSDPPLTVWIGRGSELAPHPTVAVSGAFADVYARCTEIFGFRPGQEHQLEALARLDHGEDAGRLEDEIGYKDGRLWTSQGWESVIADWLAASPSASASHRARVAGAFQRHLGRLLVRMLADVRAADGVPHLCLAGGLFYNTFFNTVARESGIFEDVFVPPCPGNPGLAAGAALDVGSCDARTRNAAVSPFLGPEYDLEQIKRVLDNCKLSCECLIEGDVIGATVEALRRGHLVGWFQGRMEWGHRALGNRSILASPFSPYVLENLNLYLKQRERYRTYGLSVPCQDAGRFFAGPPESAYMEYEYEVRDRERFRHVLPGGATRLRVQTVRPTDESSRRFASLHAAFGDATGAPVLVNTSFNGFSEPIVCSPRDALRVFFGTGLDMLVLDRFVLRK
jgi:carbamoyltransferase